jgi:predicted short-subunit dehydrogenase-like oxidoreductase (DUF2520 family)
MSSKPSPHRPEGFFYGIVIPMSDQKNNIAILGFGRVGAAVGFLLQSKGYTVSAVASRSSNPFTKGSAYTEGNIYTDFVQAASSADDIFITTPDDAIASTCKTISEGGAIQRGKRVIHMSGACDLSVLDSAREAGGLVGCIHPLQTFADTESAIRHLPGSTFGITADEKMKSWVLQIVKDLGGKPLFISEKDKPLYHAAACVASNYLVTLMSIVERLFVSVGFDRKDAVDSFLPLVKATINNIERMGTAQALTGPISRGDIETLKKHLRAIDSKCPDLSDVYRTLGIHTVDLCLRKETLSHEKELQIKNALMEAKK